VQALQYDQTSQLTRLPATISGNFYGTTFPNSPGCTNIVRDTNIEGQINLVAPCKLNVGDVMLMVGSGHGFRMLEDTVLLEIEQGLYTGEDEKERF